MNEWYLYFDHGVNLYLADLLAGGGVLYRDAQYPYGPVPVYLYTAEAAALRSRAGPPVGLTPSQDIVFLRPALDAGPDRPE